MVQAPIIVEVDGEVDLSNVSLHEARLERAVAAGGPVVVDLSDLAFVDTSGIAMLLRHAQRLSAEGRGVAFVAGPGSMAARILQIVDLPSIVALCASRSEAEQLVAGTA